MEIQGTTALVTGANGGIGQAIARELHRAGARLVLSARRAEAVRGLADELGARVVLADLSRREDVERLVAEAGAVDVLVANAALPASGSLLEFSVDEIDAALDVNLRAPTVLSRLLAPGMASRGRGALIFISSVSGKISSKQTALYSATKFGLRGLALGLRQDLADKGVGVSVVYPGFIRDAGMFAELGVTLPTGVGTRSPDQVAAAVIEAIEEDIGEITVAAAEQRLGGFLAGFAPGLVAFLEKNLGGEKLGQQVVAAQKKRR